MINKAIQIGSLGSKIGLQQAGYLQNELLAKCAVKASLHTVLPALTVDERESFGHASQELENALLNHEVDVTVHAMDRYPAAPAKGLCLAAVSNREDYNDVLVIRQEAVNKEEDFTLKKGAVIGTFSPRSKAQIMYLRPDVIVKEISGTVQDAMDRLNVGTNDACIIAKADLRWSGVDIGNALTVELHPAELVPAAGQGVLVYQCRKEDLDLRKVLLQLHNADVVECTNVERKVMKAMQDENERKLGVFCTKDKNGYFHVYAAYPADKDKPLVKIRKSQSTVYNLAEVVSDELLKPKF